jgi:hypothetical protein
MLAEMPVRRHSWQRQAIPDAALDPQISNPNPKSETRNPLLFGQVEETTDFPDNPDVFGKPRITTAASLDP